MKKFIMLKLLLLLLITVHHVISMEIFLARVLLIADRSSSIGVKNIGETISSNITTFYNKVCECEGYGVTKRLDNNKEDRFFFGEKLSLTWRRRMRPYEQKTFQGKMFIKYNSEKYENVSAQFTLCKPNQYKFDDGNAKSAFAREVFKTVFIKEYSSFYECIEKKTVEVGDKFYWEREKLDFLHCDVNSTIRFDIYETSDADCGIGGSGESFTNVVLRVFFNAQFDDCDGKKYLPFKSLPKSLLNTAKLEEAKETGELISQYPLIL